MKLYGSRGIQKNKQSKLEAHASTKCHITCVTKWSDYKHSKIDGSIVSKLSTAKQNQIMQIKCILKL